MIKKSVFILGGTSGLGLSLAQYYLKNGWRVGIAGRNIHRPGLSEVANLYRYEIDAADLNSVRLGMGDFAKRGLDLVFSVAGIYISRKDQKLSESQIREMINTNVRGVLNTLTSGAELMQEKGEGHLVAISSMTALQRYPKATVYAITKKIVLELCKLIREAYASHGIFVTEVIPGYIATEKLLELNRQFPAPRPFLLSPDAAAKLIAEAVDRKKQRIVFPWQTHLLVRILSFLPGWLQVRLLTVEKSRSR